MVRLVREIHRLAAERDSLRERCAALTAINHDLCRSLAAHRPDLAFRPIKEDA